MASAARLAPALKCLAEYQVRVGLAQKMAGIAEAQTTQSVWLARPGRPTLAGVDAFAALARCGRGAWPLLGRALAVPPVRWMAERVYRLVAANRHRLPGGTGACAIRP